MSVAPLALREAMFRSLSTHAGLTALLGGAKVYDEPPRSCTYPYVALGDARFDDWSTATSKGHEHVLALNVYSQQGGRKEAQIIAGEIIQILDDLPLVLNGHRLIAMRYTTADVKREEGGKTYRATIRFRAVTEPT